MARRFVGNTDEGAPAIAQVIQFRLEVFGGRFFALPENSRLAELHEHSNEQLRKSPVAAELGLTRTSFCRWIRSVTDRTFSALVNDHRTTQAVLLLQQTDTPVTSIALEVGYHSLSHFYREFARRHGTIPKRMRRG